MIHDEIAMMLRNCATIVEKMKPRVLSLSELIEIAKYNNDLDGVCPVPVFLEYRGNYYHGKIRTLETAAFYYGKEKDDVIFTICFFGDDTATCYSTKGYGVDWRCWKYYPTDTQRYETAWEKYGG